VGGRGIFYLAVEASFYFGSDRRYEVKTKKGEEKREK